MTRTAVVGLVLLATGCGATEQPAGPGQAPSLTQHGLREASLRESVLATIVVRPKGPDGPRRKRIVNCSVHVAACDTAYVRVPKQGRCGSGTGAPATATVSIEADGSIDTHRFTLADRCQIVRWKHAAPLLGAPPGRG